MEEQPAPMGCLGVLLRLFGIKFQGEPTTKRLPYRMQTCLLTPAERSFFGVLQKAVGERAIVFAKVRVGDLLYVPHSKGMMAHQNRINSKHVDFVLYAPDSLRLIAAIELDDTSHARPDRVKRDDFLNASFEAAKLPLIRFAARRQHELREIKDGIETALNQLVASDTVVAEGSDVPNCPTCDSPMIFRTASTGPKKGSSFYGCSNYPRCRAIVPIE
jgi:very-short-patch-repair endonuclease